jgi:hypothetical protein
VLKNFMEKLRGLRKEPTPFDPSVYADPVAMQTEWGPAKSGGSSFGTHKLVPIDSFRLEFRPTVGAFAFYLLFLVVGLVVVGGSFFAGTQTDFTSVNGDWASLFVPILVGSVFVVAGGGMLYVGAAPVVFDKRRGVFWRGRVAPHELTNRHERSNQTSLNEIHALQLVSEYCRSDKSSYYSYELNLVLTDGRRINVVDHGNQTSLREDADALSTFLDTPVWDATSEPS